MIFAETLLPALAGILFLAWCGWGLTGVLVPARWGGLRWLAWPWTGYAAFVVLAQCATQVGLNLAQIALLAAVLATLANAAYLARARRAARWAWPDGRRLGWVLVAATGVVFVLGVLPLWFYGYSTVIGENWDGEIYLALGAYLQHYAQPALSQAPPNPLLTTLLVPPYAVRTHGFSYFQAALGALSGLPSLATLSPALALLRALAVPATYAFFRTAWAWPARRALVAALVLGANPFLLWITYNTFGMQVPSFGLLPLAVAATLLALRAALNPHHGDTETRSTNDKSKDSLGDKADNPDELFAAPRLHSERNAVLRLGAYAALLTAALAVTYHPALTAWAALAGLGGLAVLLGSGRHWWRVALTGLGIGAGSVVLAAVAWAFSLRGFLAQYADQTPGLGLTAFTAPTDALGLSLSFRTLLAAGPGQPILARAVQAYQVLIIAGGLVAAALVGAWLVTLLRARPPAAAVQAATFLGGLIYLLLFVRPLDYVYGWFKAQSFVAFVLVGAVVGGAAGVGSGVRKSKPLIANPRSLLGVGLLAAVPTAALLATLGLLLWQYQWPLRYSADMVGAAQIRDLMRPGDSVLVSNSRLMPGRLFNGLLAYVLRDSAIYGDFHTANSTWDTLRPSGVYSWAVLPRQELPQPYGYRPADLAWSNPVLALYHAPPELLYNINGDEAGRYPTTAGSGGLLWRVLSDTISFAPTASGALSRPFPAGAESQNGTARTFQLGIAAFVTTTLQVQGSVPSRTGGEGGVPVQFAPGLQTFTLALDGPTDVVLAPGPAASGAAPAAPPVVVRWATLRTAADASGVPSVSAPLTNVLMLAITSTVQGGGVQTTLQRVDTRPPARQADRVVLDVYRAGGSGGEADHFGYWSFALSGPAATFTAPLPGGAAQGGPGATPLPAASARGPATSGHFTASLTFYHGSTVLDTVTDIYTFDARPAAGSGLTIANVAIRALPILFY